jgi:hypothetical protein
MAPTLYKYRHGYTCQACESAGCLCAEPDYDDIGECRRCHRVDPRSLTIPAKETPDD